MSAIVDAAALELAPEDVRRFAAALLAAIEADELPLELSPEDATALSHALEEGLRFATVLLAADPDDAALDLLAAAAARRDDEWAETDAESIAQALQHLVPAMDPAQAEVVAAAKSPTVGVRRALANGLDPRRAEGRVLLRRLAGDTYTGVRNAARQRLSAAGHDVPWWSGLFDDDPFAGADPEEAARVAAPLATLAQVLVEPLIDLQARTATLASALGALPDAHVVTLVPRILPAEAWTAEALVPELLRRAGGARALARMLPDLDRSLQYHVGRVVEAWSPNAAALPAARRDEIRVAFADRRCDGIEPADRALYGLAVACVAPGEALWPLAEAALERNDLGAIHRLLSGVPAPGSRLAEAAAEALCAGFPAPWAHCGHLVEAWLSRGPLAWLRPLAERATRVEGDRTRRWGLAMLTREAFDPSRDGDPIERTTALALDPRFVADFRVDHRLRARAQPLFRGRLRRGEATLDEALAACEPIWTGDKEPVDPPTPEDWAALRRLRFAAMREDAALARSRQYYLQAREEGHPDDEALLERLVAEAGDAAAAMDAMSVLLHGPATVFEERLATLLAERFPDESRLQAGRRLFQHRMVR